MDTVGTYSTRSSMSDASVPDTLDLVKVNDLVLPLRRDWARAGGV